MVYLESVERKHSGRSVLRNVSQYEFCLSQRASDSHSWYSQFEACNPAIYLKSSLHVTPSRWDTFYSLSIPKPPLQWRGKLEIMPTDSATGVSAVFMKFRLDRAV